MSDLSIYMAQTQDVPVLARLHVAGWQGAYGGIVDQVYLDSLTIQSREDLWARNLGSPDIEVGVAARDGVPAGFICFGKLMTPPPGSSPLRPTHPSEISALYLSPEFYRQGIGRALMVYAAQKLMTKKFPATCLWVLEKNIRARAFYDAMGGQRIGKKQIEIGGKTYTEMCYGWRDLATFLPQ